MRPTPRPVDVPRELPPELLARLLGRQRLFLFLDYDGTLSEITPLVAQARPAPGVRAAVSRLASHPERISVAIVTGREIDEVHRLLGLDRNLLFVGAHGLEVMERDRQRWLVSDVGRCMPELEKVRAWLRAALAGLPDFTIEDKGIALALHYRKAEPAQALALCQRLEAFVERETTELKLRYGKMVVEAMPRNASKGVAVRFILERAAQPSLPVYFGDDATDEDAFFALRNDGVTVVVSAEARPSWANYRVNGPADVVQALAAMTAVLDGPTVGC